MNISITTINNEIFSVMAAQRVGQGHHVTMYNATLPRGLCILHENKENIEILF